MNYRNTLQASQWAISGYLSVLPSVLEGHLQYPYDGVVGPLSSAHFVWGKVVSNYQWSLTLLKAEARRRSHDLQRDLLKICCRKLF
jgi:hypothetical protein